MRQTANWISAVVMAVCGAVLGLVVTIAHRATTVIGGAEVPTGLVLGLLAAVALILGCRLLWEHRLPTVAAALALVVTQFLVMAQPAAAPFFATGFDPVDGIWMFGPAVVAIIVLLWPERRRPPSAGAA